MWSFLKKCFNSRFKSEAVKEKIEKDTSTAPDEKTKSKTMYNSRIGSFQPRFDLVDLSSQEDEESIRDDYHEYDEFSTAGTFDEEDNSSSMKPDDRARRDEIIDTLIELGVVNTDQAQRISNVKGGSHSFSESPRCKGFILVNNCLVFPRKLNLSRCFIDYLNYRCHSGEILSRLLARKVCLEIEDQDLEDGETRPVDAEKTAVVFDLLQKRDIFYSFCLGKVVSVEDFDHCVQCHVCFEHSFWSCKTCGASTARLCQLCYPEVSCDLCEQVEEEPETPNEEEVEESDVAECYDEYTWKSLQSLSQLAIDEPENDTSSDNCSGSCRGRQWSPTNGDQPQPESTTTSRSTSTASSSCYCIRKEESDDTSDDDYELEQDFAKRKSWQRSGYSSSSSSPYLS